MKKNDKKVVEEKNEEVKVENVENVEKVEKTNKPSEKKNLLPIIIVVVVIIAIVVIIKSGVLTKLGIAKKSLQDELTTELKAMGEEFYTDFYYTEISKNKSNKEVSEFLSKFSEVGVKVNLDNLSRYDSNKNKEKIEKFKNEKGDTCNQTTTQAIIYPQSPYGKNDYKVEAELDCSFSSSEK